MSPINKLYSELRTLRARNLFEFDVSIRHPIVHTVLYNNFLSWRSIEKTIPDGLFNIPPEIFLKINTL